MELESPILFTLNTLRTMLAHFCVRGLKHVSADELKTLQDASLFFRQCDAVNFAEHIDNFLISCECDQVKASRQLLELQSRVLLFERQFSRQKAIELFSS